MSKAKEHGKFMKIAEPHDLLPRSAWLREYYFKGVDREWNNEYSPFTAGTEWDTIFEEQNFIINDIKIFKFFIPLLY